MEWYFAEAGERRGPISPAELQQLVAQGAITAETLVWRQGMESWQTYASSAPPAPVPTVPPPPVAALPAGYVACASCGGAFADSDVIQLVGRPYCATCKPLAIQRLKEGVSTSSEFDAIRNEHLKHEASVKSVGLLYYMGGIALFCMGIFAIVGAAGSRMAASGIGVAVFMFPLGVGQIFVGRGLRGLKSWARIPSGILSSLGLLAVPIGTLINAYILYLLFSAKGKMVFSDEYHEVIKQTPHIQYRTSIVVWILVGLVVVLCGGALLVPYFVRR